MANTIRNVPDPEIGLRDARDFILGSELGRRALMSREPGLAVFFLDVIEAIYRLVQSCHLPEFTDHGLPHLCSLVDRISRWENSDQKLLASEFSPDEAAIVLTATLIHDIGMLSQNPIDLPNSASNLKSKAHAADVANWVRETHVDRLENLTCRVTCYRGHLQILESDVFRWSVQIARAHQAWPWAWDKGLASSNRYRGLAAVLAVADLLDEDAARCDTSTLLKHRDGNELNKAHWFRHSLTNNRVLVEQGRVKISMVRPPGTSHLMEPVFAALRNHFRAINLYREDLRQLGAQIVNIDVDPATGIPSRESHGLSDWKEIDGFGTERALCFQLLRTFLPLVLKDTRRCEEVTLLGIRHAGLEDVDLTVLESCEGTLEPRTSIEQSFEALSSD
jgi:hypothetical protein